MEIRYVEDCDEARLDISQHRTRLSAVRTERGIRFDIRSQAGEKCSRVEAALEVCFTCEEYERLLCELARLECDFRPCDPSSPCDPCAGGVRVSVRELREQIKGLSADDVITISE